MTRGREQELKFRLSRADFLELRDGPRWGSRCGPELQVNHYFDALDGRLARSRILLRIREEAGRCLLTLKCGAEVRPGCFDSLEIEEEIPRRALSAALAAPASLLDLRAEAIDELKRRLAPAPLPVLAVAGRLENERVTREREGLVLEVDRIVFPDGEEAYELEIEAQELSLAEARIQEAAASAGIRLEPQRLTKMEQLLQWRHK